jgi:2-oxo-4-hydroxy-4-carboxy-5-ureidoimidazoline decarboxylase
LKGSEPALNSLPVAEARTALLRCCGSSRWVEAMLSLRPFGSHEELLGAASEVWANLGESDYLEAFAAHPRIGDDVAALRARFAATAEWSAAEQAGVAGADEATLQALAAGNAAYAERFGFIFIVCAAGKSAREMLDFLQARLAHTREQELALAAAEQAKITALRLDKLP